MNGRTAGPTPADRAVRLNAVLERLMPALTPAGVALGFLFSSRFVQLRPAVPWLFGAMTLSGALRLRLRDLGGAVANPKPILAFFVSAHVLMPLLAWAAGRLLFPVEVGAGFVLLFSTPTAVAGFIWATIFGGDAALTLSLILLDTLLAPLVVPATTALLLGRGVAIDASGLALSLVGMVVVPTLLGVGLNEGSRGAVPAAVGPFLAPAAKFCLILVIAANAAAVAPRVDFSEALVWSVAAGGLLLASAGFLLGRAAAALAGGSGAGGAARRSSLTFGVGLRNISAAATLAIAYFPAAAALPAILGMIFQQTLAAVLGRLLLGPPPSAAAPSAPPGASDQGEPR
jgi:predicted Na+-dependent transporter